MENYFYVIIKSWIELVTRKLKLILKEEQKCAILILSNKQNVFAILPTGYGKSIVYTVTPLILDEVRSIH